MAPCWDAANLSNRLLFVRRVKAMTLVAWPLMCPRPCAFSSAGAGSRAWYAVKVHCRPDTCRDAGESCCQRASHDRGWQLSNRCAGHTGTVAAAASSTGAGKYCHADNWPPAHCHGQGIYRRGWYASCGQPCTARGWRWCGGAVPCQTTSSEPAEAADPAVTLRSSASGRRCNKQ